MSNTPYGVSRAGVVLIDMLKDHREKKKIGSMIAELHDALNFIYKAHNTGMYHALWLGIREDFKNRASNINLPQKIANHLQSTITGILRQKRREYLISRGGLSKKQTNKLKEEYKKHYDDFLDKARELNAIK